MRRLQNDRLGHDAKRTAYGEEENVPTKNHWHDCVPSARRHSLAVRVVVRGCRIQGKPFGAHIRDNRGGGTGFRGIGALDHR